MTEGTAATKPSPALDIRTFRQPESMLIEDVTDWETAEPWAFSGELKEGTYQIALP